LSVESNCTYSSGKVDFGGEERTTEWGGVKALPRELCDHVSDGCGVGSQATRVAFWFGFEVTEN
jgi:hypothetical protein